MLPGSVLRAVVARMRAHRRRCGLRNPEWFGRDATDNAVGYACWNVARLLVARGAAVTKLWHAAALGMVGQTEELLAEQPDGVSHAFWHACAAGQRRAAELLLGRGADLNWVPTTPKGPPWMRRTASGLARKT